MVYTFLVDGFEETEAIEPIDIMRRAGIEVQTVGVNGSTVTGAHGITVKTDITIEQADKTKMELLMLPGGPGHELLDVNSVHEFINYAVANSIIIAAICAAPSIIGKKGLLDGKKATCFPGYEKLLYGAELVSDKAVRDGCFITARGAGAAGDFGFEIVAALKDRAAANKIKEMMQY
jgi:4-methyl-5(b-hydroxyethyl)-thiazole monophosphate biosynthesis